MVILDEAPAQLISSVNDNFDINSDTGSISRINENLKMLKDSRDKQQEDTRQILSLLSRKLDIAKSSYEETRTRHLQRDHSETMMNLDREKFSLAKKVNDLESNAHTLEMQLARLKDELEQLDAEDPMAKAVMEDTTLLYLKLYRDMGIDLVEDGAGGYKQAVVRNSKQGDVHIVNIESNKFSPFFYANYFWSHI